MIKYPPERKSEVLMLKRNIRKTKIQVNCNKCKEYFQKSVTGLQAFFKGTNKSEINQEFFSNQEINLCKKCKKAR